MKRAVRSIIRLVAAGLVVVGGMTIGLEFMRHRLQNAEVSVWHCLVGAALIAGGITVFTFSARLAARWTEDFEE